VLRVGGVYAICLLNRVGAECTGHLLLGDHDDAGTLRVCSRHSRPGWPLHYMGIITDKTWKLVQGCVGWVQGGGKGFASRSARPVICVKTKLLFLRGRRRVARGALRPAIGRSGQAGRPIGGGLLLGRGGGVIKRGEPPAP
jgi:hypothetical protein